MKMEMKMGIYRKRQLIRQNPHFGTVIGLLLSVLMLALVVACSNDNGNQSANDPLDTISEPKTTEPELSSVKKDPIELVMWYGSGVPASEEAYMEMYGDLIKKKFPYITPKFLPALTAETQAEQMIASKSQMDLLSVSIGGTALVILANNLQYDISDFIKKHDFDLNMIEPTSIAIQRQIANGGIYGLPISTDTMTLFYNRDIFDRFGVEYPRDGMTWEEVYDVVKSVSRTEGDTRVWGMGVSPDHALLMDPLSPVLVNEQDQPQFSTAARVKQFFETLTGVFEVPGNEVDTSNWDYGTQIGMFQKEKNLAMLLGTSALGYGYFADRDELNWDVVSYPRYSTNMETGPQAYPVYYYVSQTSKYKEDAFLVSAFLTSKEVQAHLVQYGILPSIADFSVMDKYGAYLPYMSDKNTAAFLPETFAPPAFKGKYQAIANGQVYEVFRKIVLKETDINTALREADEALQKAIAENKSQ